MSQLIDRLNQVTKAAARSLGFKSQRAVSTKPCILLIASVSQGDSGNVPGADAVLLRVSGADPGTKELGKICQAAAEIPCGGWLSNESVKEAKQVVEAGVDFIVFPADAPVAVLQGNESKIGRVLQIDESLNAGPLRAIGELAVDAVLLARSLEGKDSLTWNDLMLFRYIAGAVDRHLLVTVPSNITADELKTLWDAGVNGVIIEVGDNQPVRDLSALRQAIEGMTFTPRQKQVIARLAMPSPGAEEIETEEEEEDE